MPLTGTIQQCPKNLIFIQNIKFLGYISAQIRQAPWATVCHGFDGSGYALRAAGCKFRWCRAQVKGFEFQKHIKKMVSSVGCQV